MKELSPVPKPTPRAPKPEPGLKRGSSLRQRSKSPAARRREDDLAQAKAQAREYWGHACMVPGCPRAGAQLHHAYGRGSHPQHRAAAWNLVPLCGGERGHHRQADRPDHWLHDACVEIADVVRAAEDRRRPRVSRGEAAEICRRHQEKAERPHVSPMGAAD